MKTANHSPAPLEALFLDELADMYDAENRLVRALPRMVKATTREDLQGAFESHLSETRGHVETVRRVFAAFGRSPRRSRCEAIEGLLMEADEIVADHKGSPAIDAALISAAQKVEHYEIASYGCLHEWAASLGNEEAAVLLRKILEEEKTADESLTVLARWHCNEQALGYAIAREASPTEEGERYLSRRSSKLPVAFTEG